jgi:hypothetical protein
MLKRLFTCALAIPLMGVTLSACGDDGGGGGGGGPDAARPDGGGGGGPDGGGGIDGGGPDAGVQPDLSIKAIAGSRITPFPDYAGNANLLGAAHLVRMGDGLRAELYVEGLTPEIEYIAHVHRLPCAEDLGGGHYKHDPTIVEELEDNEIWLRFTTDVNGRGVASTEQIEKIARMDAQSIVIHDPEAGDVKMACADLNFDDAIDATIDFQGTFAALADAPAGDANIGGTVTMSVTPANNETTITLALENLDAAATYVAYVQDLPCGVDQGGAHYKRDTTVVDVVQDNEIWLDVAVADAQVFTHAVRKDAQSVVIHRAEPDEPKVACANLDRATEIPELVTDGQALELPRIGNPYRNLNATVTLSRNKDGTTSADLTVAGMPADVTGFGAYVYAGTCNLDPPGGDVHYKVDVSVVDEQEANEMWLNFDADAAGVAASTNAKADHVARPDAISVVIFDPDTTTRLSCVELQ